MGRGRAVGLVDGHVGQVAQQPGGPVGATDAAVSSGRSSMKVVVTGSDWNCASARIACRYG